MPVESAPGSPAADDSALSFKQGVEDITSLLDGPDNPAPEEEDQDQEANVDGGPEDETGPDETEASADDTADDEEEDGPGYTKGKFASDDAKVTLKDGTALSVAELKRGFLAQRDYSRQTQEVKAERDAVQADRARMNEIAKALVAQRDFLLQVQAEDAPKPPDESMLDPNSPNFDVVGYMGEKAKFEKKSEKWQRLQYDRQVEAQRLSQESEDAEKAERAAEQKLLFDKVPEFRDRKVYAKFLADANDVMTNIYGFNLDELAGTKDHRMYRAIRDLVKLHKATKAAPAVKEQLQGKPPLMKGGKRMDPKSKFSREAQQRTERLAKTGSREAGIAALMDIPDL